MYAPYLFTFELFDLTVSDRYGTIVVPILSQELKRLILLFVIMRLLFNSNPSRSSLNKNIKIIKGKKQYLTLCYLIVCIGLNFVCVTSASSSSANHLNNNNNGGYTSSSKRRNTSPVNEFKTRKRRGGASSNTNHEDKTNERNDLWDAFVSFSKNFVSEENENKRSSTSFVIPISIMAATIRKLLVDNHIDIDVNDLLLKQKNHFINIWDRVSIVVLDSNISEKIQFIFGSMAGSFFVEKALPKIQLITNWSITTWLVITQLLPPVLMAFKEQQTSLDTEPSRKITNYVEQIVSRVNDSLQMGLDWFHKNILGGDVQNTFSSIQSLWEKEKPLWTGAVIGALVSCTIGFLSK